MADVKISALPASTTPLAGTEILPIVQSSTTRQVSVDNLTAGRAVSALSITASSLTSGRVTYAGTAGLLQDSANLTFNGTTLTANTIGAYTLGGTIAGGGNQINNVIIGTTTPLAGSFTTLLASGVATFSAGTVSLPAITTTGDTNTGIYFPAADTIAFTEGGAESMRITSAGLVGIGTSSPGSKLTVASGGIGLSKTYSLLWADSNLEIRADDAPAWLAVNNTMTFKTYAGAFVFQNSADASSIMTVRVDTARVGIGTNSPDALLSVNGIASFGDGAAATPSIANFGDLNTGFWFPAADTIAASTGGSERMRIDSSGNLLVGTTTAAGKFCVTFNGATENGTVYRLTANTSGAGYMYYQDDATNTCGSVVRVGTTSAVVYNTTSDYRLKTVIGAVTGQGERIDALKPIDYQWKEGNQQSRGFLAHEFQTVYPNSVSGDKDAIDSDGKPVYQGMQASSTEVIADLIAEIQSLRQRITTLENK